MSRVAFFLYGVICYFLFLVAFLYAIGFVGGFYVSHTLDGKPISSTGFAIVVNTLLLGLFAVQHSVMARPGFKRWWTQYIPKTLERSTYVLFSSLALLLLYRFWQPMGGTVWNFTGTFGRGLMYTLFGFGWTLVFISTFLTNHFELFGLRQVTLPLLGKEYTPLPFKTPLFYNYVRHPLYLGWLFAFWFTPTMTMAHLLFALVTSLYILIAIRWEERDLCVVHPEYEDYRNRVPMIIPRWAAKTK